MSNMRRGRRIISQGVKSVVICPIKKNNNKRFISDRKSEKYLAYGLGVGGIIIMDPSLESQCLSLDPKTLLWLAPLFPVGVTLN